MRRDYDDKIISMAHNFVQIIERILLPSFSLKIQNFILFPVLLYLSFKIKIVINL